MMVWEAFSSFTESVIRELGLGDTLGILTCWMMLLCLAMPGMDHPGS